MDTPEYTPVFPSADLAPEDVQRLVEAYRGMSDAERWVVAIEGSERAARGSTQAAAALRDAEAERLRIELVVAGVVVGCLIVALLAWALLAWTITRHRRRRREAF